MLSRNAISLESLVLLLNFVLCQRVIVMGGNQISWHVSLLTFAILNTNLRMVSEEENKSYRNIHGTCVSDPIWVFFSANLWISQILKNNNKTSVTMATYDVNGFLDRFSGCKKVLQCVLHILFNNKKENTFCFSPWTLRCEKHVASCQRKCYSCITYNDTLGCVWIYPQQNMLLFRKQAADSLTKIFYIFFC
jgi:hypothetical protein